MSAKFAGILFNLGLGATLGGGLVYSAKMVTSTMERLRGTVEVKGYGEKDLKSDSAQWNVTVYARNLDAKAAYSELETSQKAVLEQIKKFAPKDMKMDVGRIVVEEKFKQNANGFQTSELDHYEVSRNISISSLELENTRELSIKVSELVGQGISLNSGTPQFLLSRDKLEKAKIDLLAEATMSARQRANQFATNSGTKIGRLVSARQGVFQIVGDQDITTSTDNNYSQYDTQSINKVLKLAVTLSYTTGD